MPELSTETPAAGASTPAPRGRRKDPPAAAPPDASSPVAIAPAPDTGEVNDLEIPGRADPPPPAHGGIDRPPAPAVWSYPAGMIAGRDNAERHRPLESPPAPSLGPEGKRRAPWAVVTLSVVTLGVYALIWHHRVNCEAGDFDTRMYVKPRRSTLGVGLAWFAGLLVSAAGAVLVVAAQMHVTLPYQPPLTTMQQYLLLGGLLVVPYLVLALPFALIGMVMTLERVRIIEDRMGRPTDVQIRPVASVWWLVVPIAGGLILQAVVQSRLNQVWELVAPTPAARISEY